MTEKHCHLVIFTSIITSTIHLLLESFNAFFFLSSKETTHVQCFQTELCRSVRAVARAFQKGRHASLWNQQSRYGEHCRWH